MSASPPPDLAPAPAAPPSAALWPTALWPTALSLVVLLLVVLPLGGCSDGRLSPLEAGAAPGLDVQGEAVDGLTVGHRLMAAGEYELALDEYYRAAADQGLTADVLSALGSANLRLGRLGQAERLLRRAISEDEEYAAAWNNLGVVLMERGETGEAARVFRTAFALDSGRSVEIRENLRVALARLENPADTAEQPERYKLVRRGAGTYRILSTP